MIPIFNKAWRAFGAPPSGAEQRSQWGGLIFNLGLLIFVLYLFTQRAYYKGDPYGPLFVTVALLLNQLAFSFRWPVWLAIVLRVFACGWLLFTFFYFFFLTDVLFPRSR